MKIPRFIPKHIFQIIALLLLALCLVLTIRWITADAGLYEIIRRAIGREQRAMAMALTFLGLLAAWVAVVLPLRMLSQMPTMKEGLGAELSDGWPAVAAGIKRLYAKQVVKNEEMYAATEYTPEMTHHARQIGLSFLIAGVILTLAGIWMIALLLETRTIYILQILLLIAGPVLTIVGLIQLITGRSVIRK